MTRAMPEVYLDVNRSQIENDWLLKIQEIVFSIGKNLVAQYGLLTSHEINAVAIREYSAETSYDTADHACLIAEYKPTLTNEQ